MEFPSLLDLLSIQHTFLRVFGYEMSFLEFAGTLLNLASVWLVSRGRLSNWPIGIAGALVFALFFYQLRLYADFLEQLYYIGASVYGWRLWLEQGGGSEAFRPRYSSKGTLALALAVTLVLSICGALLLMRVHEVWPRAFPEPASLPWLDSLTTVGSFTAMILMAKKRTEVWLYWLLLNAISIGLYAFKGTYFVAALYGVYLILAVVGWRRWLARG